MTKDQARENLEEAVLQALESGMSRIEVESEVEYAIKCHDEELASELVDD